MHAQTFRACMLIFYLCFKRLLGIHLINFLWRLGRQAGFLPIPDSYRDRCFFRQEVAELLTAKAPRLAQKYAHKILKI